jgi:Non-ribosomal peptide synthetase modules and related proteins
MSFDLTVTSVFGSLLKGRGVYIYPPEMEIGEIFRQYASEGSGQDIIKLTPAHIELLGSLELKGSGLKKVIVGGEQLRVEQVRILQGLNGEMAIYNEYGPTEATVGCSVSKIQGREPEGIDIGRPVRNMRIYILDEQGRLVGEGITGEMYIGGEQLARGYLGQPEQTAEKFVERPVVLAGDGSKGGGRLYRTGDLGRWLPGGRIEYVGRRDDQVKIRGYRVELGEIEQVLRAYPDIKDAVVLTRASGGGTWNWKGIS